MFDVRNFDLLIGHPIEKLLTDAPTQGKIDVHLGKETISVQIARATSSMTEPSLDSKSIEEVKGLLPVDSPESLFEKDAEKFIEEEDDSTGPVDLSEFKTPRRPPIELKLLPIGLCYAFHHGDTESPVSINYKLSEEEYARLITILEKHRTVLGYSLQDLKGISPALCTHRIPLDSTITPSRELHRRLNNAMREVVKKEVLKLLDTGIIYPVPHSEWVSPVQVVPKKGRMTVVPNDKNELIAQHLPSGWRICIDYRKLNKATKKDYFLLPFIDEMLEQLETILSFVSLMGIPIITKSPSIPMIKTRPLSHAPMEPMLILGCHSGYAMHQPHSKGA